jgi:hypothetical protein
MGGELLESEGSYERDDGHKPSNDQNLCQDDWSAQEENGETTSRGSESLVKVLVTTVRHFFPEFNQWLGKIRDPRNQQMITYCRKTLVWAGLVMMLTKQGARSKISNQLRGGLFLENLRQLSGQHDLKTAPHGDTAEYFSRQTKPDELEEYVQVAMIQNLLRKRVLESGRLMIRSKDGGGKIDKYYMVAIDGLHTHSFDYAHCPGCLVKTDKKTGKKTWMHYKLQASLVNGQGLCLPVCCEWIENEGEYEKQDCELKAFYRLIMKIRKYFPCLRICMFLDSLYASGPVMKALKEARMEWMIVFKEGAMPWVWGYMQWAKKVLRVGKKLDEQETRIIESRQGRTHEQRLIRQEPKHETRLITKETSYEWVNRLDHIDGVRTFNVLSCREVEDNHENCNYTWLVSDGLNLCEETVKALSQGGRCRWVIENEGNNMQKNGGYNLEHLYSRDENSMKVWNVLLDIAHIINQLIERGSLIVRESYGTLRDLAQRLFEHLRYFVYKKPLMEPKIQIRLNSS